MHSLESEHVLDDHGQVFQLVDDFWNQQKDAEVVKKKRYLYFARNKKTCTGNPSRSRLQMTRAIVNRRREVDQTVRNDHVKVSIATIRRSAKTTFSGVCKNRALVTRTLTAFGVWRGMRLHYNYSNNSEKGTSPVQQWWTSLCANSLRRSCT